MSDVKCTVAEEVVTSSDFYRDGECDRLNTIVHTSPVFILLPKQTYSVVVEAFFLHSSYLKECLMQLYDTSLA